MKPNHSRFYPFVVLLFLLGSAVLAACGTLEVGIETPGAAAGTSPANPAAGMDTPYPAPEENPPPPAELGIVRGTICFPSETIPPMTAYFQNMDTGKATELPITENQTEYAVTLEPASYIAFAYLPDGSFGGMYSEAVACGLDVSCGDHSPIVFEVAAGVSVEGVAICDWYAQEALPPRPMGVPLAGLVYRTPYDGALFQIDFSGRHQELFREPGGLISPDGQMVLFPRDQDLWVVDLETGEARNLTNTPDRVETDGRWWPANPGVIVFGSWDNAEETVYFDRVSLDDLDRWLGLPGPGWRNRRHRLAGGLAGWTHDRL